MSVITTNVMSLHAQRSVAASNRELNVAVSRLSSGLRINSAKDDAAGLAISERMSSQIRGLDMAARNANDGISLAQTAEGAMGEISNNLQRIRELAVQSANATNSNSDRAAMQAEVQALSAEIIRVIDSSEFNGVKLLDGSATAGFVFQIGANAGDEIAIAGSSMDLSDVKAAMGAPDTEDPFASVDMAIDVSTPQNARAAITTAQDQLEVIHGVRASMGAIQNRFQSAIHNIQLTSENLGAARSRIRDADFAKETAELTRAQILNQASTAMLAQANASTQSVLSLLR